MCKEIYKSAFDILKMQNEMCDKFEDIGLCFEYGHGFMGVTLEELSNKAYTIILSVMGFNRKTMQRTINISGYPQGVCFDVLYIGEYDENWTITEDDFSDFVHTAVRSEKLQEWFWRAMIEKDESAKEEFNKATKMFKIGSHWKDC